MKIAAVVVGHNSYAWLERCLTSLTQDISVTTVIYVDNASSDSSVRAVARFSDVRIISLPKNLGYGVACNVGASFASRIGCDTAAFLNPDVVIEGRVLEELGRVLSGDVQLAAVGPLQREMASECEAESDSMYNTWTRKTPLVASLEPILHTSVNPMSTVNFNRWLAKAPDVYDVSYVNGAIFVVSLSKFWAVGGFNPAFFLFFEEVDLCRRLRLAGYKICLSKAHEAEHAWGGHTSGSRYVEWLTSRLIYIASDPVRGPWAVVQGIVSAAIGEIAEDGTAALAPSVKAIFKFILRGPRIARLRRLNRLMATTSPLLTAEV